jgi:citrate lyase beta subunit
MRSGMITNGLHYDRLVKAAELDIDMVMLELEDGIVPERKDEARRLVAKALLEVDWAAKLTAVRVDPVGSGRTDDDVIVVASSRPTAFLLGKCRGPEDIRYMDSVVSWAEGKHGIPKGTIRLGAMIETLAALQTVEEIAVASPRMLLLAIGPSDLGNEVGFRRTYRGQELEVLFARSRIVMAAHGAGLLAVGSPYIYYKDVEGTYDYARWAYQVGHDLCLCLSPRQVDAVNRAFSPSADELAWARDVLQGVEQAHNVGQGAWIGSGLSADLGDKSIVMMDAPHVTRARNIMARANRADASQ